MLVAQQEPLYSQYMFNMLPLNPAIAGSREALNATMYYKKQWLGIESAPVSQTFSVHGLMKNEKVGLGLAISHEKISVFGSISAQLSYAYIIPMGMAKLSLGLQAGIVNNTANLSGLRFEDPLENGYYGSISKIFPVFGTGIYLNHEKYFVGLSIPKISAIKSAPTGMVAPQMHLYSILGYQFSLGENFILRPSVLNKISANTFFQTDLNILLQYQTLLGVGASYRTNESIVGMLQIHMGKFKIGYAYDYGVGILSKNFNGSHEILLIFETSMIKDKVVSPRFF
jgi:type IX secretion system PorP/SprF family membrane protein